MASNAHREPTPEDVLARKIEARKQLKDALKVVTQDSMAAESAQINAQVTSASWFQDAARLGIYVHCARLREVDTSSLLATALHAGKRCYVPVVQDNDSNMKLLHLDELSALSPVPPFGIMEPSPNYADGSPREDVLQADAGLDVLLMPGLGFDAEGRRLGRGGGYYDKMLLRLKEMAAVQGHQTPLLVGLAYEAQLLPEVPTASHDEGVDIVVTAKHVYRCTDRGKRVTW